MKKLSILLLLCISMITNAQVTNGLVGHWPLDGNANDLANANHGTVYGAALTTGRDNTPNSAYAFNGGEYIDLGDPAALDFSGEFTISIWVYKTQNASSYHNGAIGKWNTGGSPGTNEWLIYLSSGAPKNDPQFTVEIGTSSYSVPSYEELTLNQWHHIAAIKRTNSIEIYLDGVIKGIKGIPNTPINDVGRKLEIGRFRDDIYFEDGNIDELKIYNRALSQSEVLQLFNETNATEICEGLFSINGDIGINTDNTNGYKLAVKGNVIAEKIKVQVFPWADFVFEDDYKLPTLAEVENHIKEKGHLEHIPSAEEVEENGIYLGDMDAKLLRKIEELMLYTIAQDKEIKKQEVLIDKLEAIKASQESRSKK